VNDGIKEVEEKKSHRRRDEEPGADVKERKHRSKEEVYPKESSHRDGEKDRKEKRPNREEVKVLIHFIQYVKYSGICIRYLIYGHFTQHKLDMR